jgi:para-nitrobenzyl esterase
MQSVRLGPNSVAGGVSEDCLFLNVWTPEWPSRGRRPVMVEIHGGGHYSGAGSLDLYNGESLSRHGVVLVSINYRLGVFGLLAHSELTRESPHHASGNQGLLDQVAALQWVHDNIATFGGDPTNVTILGQSSGAFDVSVLMTSPLTRGLFRRAIAQSGTVTTALVGGESTTLAFRPRSDAEKNASALAASLKIPDSLGDLRQAAARDLVEAAARVTPRYGPVVDGYVVPRLPAEVFAAGQQHPVDLIAGSSARERIPGTSPPADIRTLIEQGYGPLAPRAIALYEQTGADLLYGPPPEQWAADSSFRCSAVAQLRWHATASYTAYQYEFQRAAPGREAFGAEHTADIVYVFGTLDRGFAATNTGSVSVQFNNIDQRLADAMQRYFTNFAKTGNPNDGVLPKWPTFNQNTGAYLKFADNIAVSGEGLRRSFCDIYLEHVARQIAR